MAPDAPDPPARGDRHGAGIFSGLFGVRGGVVIVPLLVLWLGYGEREATGTSLAAIVVMAAAAAIVQFAYGNVRAGYGLAIGVPAVGGVLVGTWLQQRIPTRWITLGFAALLVGGRRRVEAAPYGNLRVHDGMLLGVIAIGGSVGGVGGVVIANTVSERTLEVTFACLVLFVAYRLVRRSFAASPERPRAPRDVPDAQPRDVPGPRR